MLQRLSSILVLATFLLTGFAYSSDLSKTFARTSPSVVLIRSYEHHLSPCNPLQSMTTESLASGVIISEDGLVMTAAHVIQVADSVIVEAFDGQAVPATVVSSAIVADVALLKLEKSLKNTTVARLGDSDKVSVGDEVYVIGAPYGMKHTLTVGNISGRRTGSRITGQFTPVEFFQTDAAINQGNSGGPLFNKKGEVVGIVSHILSQSGGFEGIGFAATINIAKQMLLVEQSFWAGMEGFFVSGELARALNIPQNTGMLIQRVADRSPAAAMGLRPGTIPVRLDNEDILLGGDIVLEFQGITLKDTSESIQMLRKAIDDIPTGEQLYLKILRAGEIVTLSTVKR